MAIWGPSEIMRFFVPVYMIGAAFIVMENIENAPEPIVTEGVTIVLGDPDRWGGSCSIEVDLDNLRDMVNGDFIRVYANCYHAFEGDAP